MSEKKERGIRTLASSLVERISLFSRAGIQFEGNRDLYKVFGYKRNLTYSDYFVKYLRQDVAKRVVNAPASATWRNPPTITGPNNFTEAFDVLAKKYDLWGQIDRVDKIAGIGHYAILLLGINDSGAMDQPVKKSETNELLYIQPYSEINATIAEIDQNVKSPRFGLPSMYKVNLLNPETALNAITQVSAGIPALIKSKEINVHYTRIVHIAEDLLENNFLGTPRLQCVFNLFDDLLKTAGGTAETYWLIANRGMQADIDKDADITDEDAQALSDELDEYQHQLRRWIKTRGVTIKSLGGDNPDPKNTFDMLISLISGATGIPRRILTGSEAGQLASDQDRANWSDRIQERRVTFAEPRVLSPLLLALSEAGVLPSIKKEDIVYTWPVNFQLTPLEDAQTMAQRARAIVNIAKHFKEPHPFVTIEEARVIVGLPPEMEGVLPQSSESSDDNDDDEDLGERDPDEATNTPPAAEEEDS